jgi:hypothetical protein
MPQIYNEIDYNEYNGYNGYNSDDTDDTDDSAREEVFYENDEISNTKYNIILCEIFNNLIHGKSNSEVNKHYLNICTFKQLNMKIINEMCELYNDGYIERSNALSRHKIIRNYHNIITHPNYIKPEIGEKINLPSGHCICIIKTLWLKIIQRAWKKVYQTRKNVIRQRCTIDALNYRRITGKWPENCNYLPDIRGMLSELSY